MNLKNLKQSLANNPEHNVVIQFESGMQIAPHFHVTEIGKVTKDFVDCGGTRRNTVSCVLQTWVADDIDHRLMTDKLVGIIEISTVLELDDELPVEVEFQTDTIGVYTVSDAFAHDGKFVIKIRSKNTACLANEKCEIDALPVAGQTGCC